jgi:hypothetical protein
MHNKNLNGRENMVFPATIDEYNEGIERFRKKTKKLEGITAEKPSAKSNRDKKLAEENQKIAKQNRKRRQIILQEKRKSEPLKI